MDNINDKVSTPRKLAYAMGEFPGGYLTTLISFFFLIYLTDFIKISPAWAGAIIFTGFIFDGFTDPFAGYLSDNSKSKFGRRRIFMLGSIVPLGLLFLAMFTIPSFVMNSVAAVKIIVVLAVYFVYIIFYTLYTTPYFALINDMTDNYDERTSMMSWRMSLSIFAILVAVIIPDLLGLSNVQTFTKKGFLLMGIIFGLLVIASGLISVFGIKEKRRISTEKVNFTFKKYFFDSWKCAPFRQACLTYFFSFACLAAVNTCLIYYLNYYLQLPSLFLPMAGGVMIIAIAFLPFWNIMCQKFGKKKSQILGAIIISLGLLLLLTVPARLGNATGNEGDLTIIKLTMGESLKLFPIQGYIATILISCGFSALQMVSSAIIPDAINFSSDKALKDEGAYYGIVTFIFKIGTGLASLIIGLVLQISKYIIPPNDMLEGQIIIQPHSAQIGILIVFVGLPCLLAMLSIFSLRKYNIDREKLRARAME